MTSVPPSSVGALQDITTLVAVTVPAVRSVGLPGAVAVASSSSTVTATPAMVTSSYSSALAAASTAWAMAAAAMPLPATSVTASAASSTVTELSALVRAVVRVMSTVAPLFESAVVVSVFVRDFTVILVRSTEPMFSLKVRMIFVPSLEALGAPAPVVTSVGFTPSTLWLAEAGTASWSRSASGLPPPDALIVPLLRVSLFAATERPSASTSPAATVYPANTSVAPPLPELESSVSSVPPTSISSCGVPVTLTASLKVTDAVTASPVLKAPSVPAPPNAMESTPGTLIVRRTA